MAQLTESKINEIQQQQMESLAQEIYRCAICQKNKQHLYICNHEGCPRLNQLLCTRCGPFIHDEDVNHDFNIQSSHIREASQTIQIDQSINREAAQQMHLMSESLIEQKESDARVQAITAQTYYFQALASSDKIAELVRNEDYFVKAASLLRAAFQEGDMSKVGSHLKTVLFDIGDVTLETTKVCNEGAVICAGVVFGIEACYHTFRLIRRDISFKNYVKKISVAATSALGAAVGNVGGTAVGAALGTFVFPVIGTAVGGALGGLIGAVFVGAKAKQAIEESSWFNDHKEQEFRRQIIKEALDAFGFEYRDIANSTIFNQASITKKYRIRAKEAHPDRPSGSADKFCKLNNQMSILLALLDQDDYTRRETANSIRSITL